MHRPPLASWVVLRLTARTAVPALDTGSLMQVLAELPKHWRALPFERGCYRHEDGRLREGLRVEHGRHPHPDAGYRLVTRRENALHPSGPAAGSPAVFPPIFVELLADDADRIRIRLEGPDRDEVAEIEVDHPQRPARLWAEGSVPVSGSWLVRGRVSARIELDLDGLPPARSSGPQLTAQAKHRRARGTAKVRVEQAGGDTWNLTVDLAVAGRGITRPVVAVLGLFRRIAAREFHKLVAETSRSIGELNRELHSRLGPGQDAELWRRMIMRRGNGSRAAELPGALR
jgi:hypothetical protein